MHTKDVLAEALRNAHLDDLAEKAARGEFDDFLSDLMAPQVALVGELLNVEQTPAVKELIARVMAGDFDATAEEAMAWAKSRDGEETFRHLGINKPQ